MNHPTNLNRLILLSVAFLALVIIALILAFDSTSHTLEDHRAIEKSTLVEKNNLNGNNERNWVNHETKDKKIAEHPSAIVLPDFHLDSDKISNQDFEKLFQHFSSVKSSPEKNTISRKKYPSPVLVETIKQIHHGIYKIEAKFPSASGSSSSSPLVKFAFKTECRPASKWHGQQGFSEVLVNWVVKQLFSGGDHLPAEVPSSTSVPFPIGSFTLGAVGGFIQLPSKFEQEIHRDGCGYLTNEQLAEMEFVGGENKNNGQGKILVGVVLQWVPGHRDDAIPGSQFLDAWRVDGKKFKKSFTKSVRSNSILQMADIFCLDYIVGNEDRLEKNWFKDSHGRFFAMDNGWALAGLNYAGSVCDLDLQNLKCPPLFRGLASKECKHDEIVNCRFRSSTINQIKKFVATHQHGISSSIVISDDPLMKYLVQFYGKISRPHQKKNGNKSRLWSDALARFVDSCVSIDQTQINEGNENEHGRVVDTLIRAGLVARAQKLLEHVDACATRFGKSEVLLE